MTDSTTGSSGENQDSSQTDRGDAPPPQTPQQTQPDALDVADNFGVFRDVNYKVSPEWREILDTSGVTLNDEDIEGIVNRSFGDHDTVGQREFVRSMIGQLRCHLSAKSIEILDELSLNHVYSEDAGIVALAIDTKEKAKTRGLLSIRRPSGEKKHIVCRIR